MKSIRRLARVFVAIEIAACIWTACSLSAIERQVASWKQARPPFTLADVQTVGIAATFEAQVLPEPLRSQAYRAIAWTMRNRVASGYNGIRGYSDEGLLDEYLSFRDHRDDTPDPLAVANAAQVMGALTSDDDPTRGARHYVDNSYWTGTHKQTGTARKQLKFSDADVQQLVDEGRFTLVIEWKSPLGHPLGPLFYGLYFFDSWPPPVPVSTPAPRSTPFPQSTVIFERRAWAGVPSTVPAATPTAAAR